MKPVGVGYSLLLSHRASAPANRKEEPRDTVTVGCAEPPSFNQTRDEVTARVRDLTVKVRQACPTCSARVAAALGLMEELTATFDQTNTIQVKYELRNLIWELRQGLEEGPPEGQTPALKRALEKARTACFDNSWETSLKRIPSQQWVCRPRLSDVPNFDQVEEGFTRGGQPEQDGVDWLVARGVATEVDLRGDDRDNQWVAPEWKNVKRYTVDVPDYEPPTFAQVEEFVRLVQDPANRPVFVHCKAGVGRTGVMIACWRITQGMSAEDALARERIHSYNGSLRQEEFVRRFEEHWKNR